MKFSIQTLIWVSVLLALLVAGSLAFLPKPIEVETASASESPLKLTVKEDGKTRIREKYIVSAPVAGRLSRIELNAGDSVSDDGTLIAVILPAEPAMLDARAKARAEAQVEQAEASLKRAESNAKQLQVEHDLSQSKFNRLKNLKTSGAVTTDEIESAQAELLANSHSLRTANFDVDIAKFEREMAKAALLQFDADGNPNAEPFEVYSPIAGKVLRVFQESSTVLSVGTPLIELGDPENLEMEIDVLSTDAVQIEIGAELLVEHWGGKAPLKGLVRVVEPAAFTKISSLGVEEQRVNVIADFDEHPDKLTTLGDGYRVEAEIVVQELSKTLSIPNSALFRYQRDWHVFKVEQEVATMQKVEVGLQNDSHSQILSGLVPDELVVLYPSDQLQDGSSVKIAD